MSHAPTDAKLIALGEQLKVASAEVEKLRPDRRLYEACWKAADFESANKIGQNAEAERRFFEKARQNGYAAARKKWNALCEAEFHVANAILRTPSNSRTVMVSAQQQCSRLPTTAISMKRKRESYFGNWRLAPAFIRRSE